MVFVDTGVWCALSVPRDPNHERVKSWFDANRDLLFTTDDYVDETLTLLVARGRLQLALQLGRAFFEERPAKLHFLTPGQIRRAWVPFQQRAATGWSFTDRTSKVVIDELGITTAGALDDHFRQFGIDVVP